jgi:hypothetical protein
MNELMDSMFGRATGAWVLLAASDSSDAKCGKPNKVSALLFG